MMAPVALQMAECAVGNIRRTLHGEGAEPFAYKDPGSLATIGRNAAVASLRGVHFSGFVAWVLWLLVHLVQLISFRNRLLVLFSWAREYLLYDRAVRLIVGVGARRSRAQMDRERR
jgi:NADH dehydrogenase